MKTEIKSNSLAHQKPLRLWPGIIIVILQWATRFVVPLIIPGTMALGVFGGLFFGLLLVIWWAFFSRAPRFERWFAIVLATIALITTRQFIHISIATTMMGLMFPVYSIPVLSLAFVIWALVSRNLTQKLRFVTMVATILLASGFWVILRTTGMDGQGHQYFAWRWAKTPEERLLSGAVEKLKTIPQDQYEIAKEAEWPGFRGINRDGIMHGTRIGTDWSKSPPKEMWRRSVGPACSSFAILGNLLYTQEQRGEYEMVTCYELNSGEPVWIHKDSARFWDAHAGAGPRSTPAISRGRIYTSGATGILNALDARDGHLIWSHNAAKDTKVKLPGWGFTGSPLIVDSLVFIGISGQLIAYDIATGQKRWCGPDGGESYSSPHLLLVDGMKQVVFMNGAGATAFAPADGRELWRFAMKGSQIVQPAMASSSDLLVCAGDLNGIQRIALSNNSGKWTATEKWKSAGLKPYFNDFVIHNGYAYGFDGPSLACIDIGNGEQKWKGARYTGEIILLADQDLLLVLTEKGEIALVKATPEQFKELARFPAIKGKTWNHPALSGDILVIRNSAEMAAFRLPHENNSTATSTVR